MTGPSWHPPQTLSWKILEVLGALGHKVFWGIQTLCGVEVPQLTLGAPPRHGEPETERGNRITCKPKVLPALPDVGTARGGACAMLRHLSHFWKDTIKLM